MYLYNLFIASFEKGGIIMWPIFGVSIVAWVIGIDKLFYLNKFIRARKRFLDVLSKGKLEKTASFSSGSSIYDSLLKNIKKVKNGECTYSYIFREFLIFSVDDLEKNLSTMNAWISTAPLLGLLGTVAGMIHTFNVITEFGIDNPNLMAEGISIALLTTQAGLTVAFPAMLFHNHLLSKKNILVGLLMKDGKEMAAKFEGTQPE